MSAIIVGLIAGISAVICQLIISLSGRSQARKERAESNELIVYRLEQLENKVTVHNNVIERVYALERDKAVMQEQIKDIEEAEKNDRR